ncbi:hypothetical protein H839_11414 [Parageobacillus genomosp. 1]|uniref:Uncharacterized protein n=1 Tax=Parageobacillus genomosp. 1 TaxID=1295642 RepID=A0ABC9VBW5_9BACL|nr:hypothetical protein H839_11414 [Parageobacillus genomosp. 1]
MALINIKKVAQSIARLTDVQFAKMNQKSALLLEQQGACEMDFGGVGGQIFYEINRQTCYNIVKKHNIYCVCCICIVAVHDGLYK